MRAKALLSLAGAFIAAVALVSASGAATAKAQKVTKINVSTRAAVVHYLRSIHVNPKGAVIQRGLRNYAGARCPGKGWTCASTRHTVVQISKRGGQNRFVCRSSKCVVVQLAGVAHGLNAAGRALASSSPTPINTASCIKTTGVTQSCLINQPNATGTNKAVVWMDTGKLTGLTQSAHYSASITQGPASAGNSSNWNLACVHQLVSIDGSATKTNAANVTITNDAHESVLIKQNSLTGNNTAQGAVKTGNTYGCDSVSTSPATQDQTLTSTVTTKGSITQNQDAAFSLCGDGVAGDYANLCLDVEQNQSPGFKCTTPTTCPSSGTNTAAFTQTSIQAAIANTPKGPVSQTQSTPVCGDPGTPADCVFPGGLVGTVNQDSSGNSTATPIQDEKQCEDAKTSGLAACSTTPDSPNIPGGLTQKQYGPVGVGTLRHNHQGRSRVGFSHGKGLGQAIQTGNGADSYMITQTSTQNADHGATQQNFGHADCSTDGLCMAAQTTTVNGSGTSDGYTAPSIPNLTINCPTGGPCVPTPPPDPTLTNNPTDGTNSTSATFEFTDPATDAQFICILDGNVLPAGHCGSPTVVNKLAHGTQTYSGLSYGTHHFQVEAVDTSGNLSHAIPATPGFTWTIVPPTPTIDTGPPSTSNSPEASFTFHDSDSSLGFVCSIDGFITSHPCSSGQRFIGLADGSHTFLVKATDGAGHFSAAASQTWTVQVFTWSGAQLTATNVDIGEFGVGGMRGTGTGSIAVSGVGAAVLRAYLYWNGPTNSSNPNSNADVSFNGNSVTGTNIGTASDNSWGFVNGQSYRADVTSLVNGDGTYTLGGFRNTNADINGVSLIVFYDDGSTANDRNIVLWNGNDSNVTPSYDPDGWDETLTNVPYPGSGSASLDLVVSDGQSIYDDAALIVNGTTVAPAGAIFSGDSVPPNQAGGLWDVKSFPITSLLSLGTNNLEITTGVNQDYLSLVVAIANTPAS